MRKLMLGLLVAATMLVASCANVPHGEGSKQCSDTPHKAISTFLEGVREFSTALMRAVIPDGTSLFGVFGDNDESRGREVVRQIAAHPEVASESGSCSCSLLSMIDTSDPQEKIVVLKRDDFVGDDTRYYRRAFRVRFNKVGNCILTINPIGSRWERII